ncbi:hypothetical protein [Paraburkholderia youngii]|uniref:hypothetical protein n=1 Tax=Paraburkholderia youngii TaxID=2782701 RepID=UPI003D23049A
MAITETADGTVLLHCFRNECAVADIAGAVGLDLSDLFPQRFDGVHVARPVRRRFSAAQALAAINLDVLEVLVIIGAILRRGSVTAAEYERLRLSVSRVSVLKGATYD